MSGRSKRILYTVFMTVTGLVAVAGTILVGFFGVIQDADQTLGCSIALVIFALFCIFLPPNVLIHECGHLCFGALFGMQFVSVSVSRLQISKQGLRRLGKRAVAGEARMLPRNENKIRLKSAFYSIGGAVFNLIYGAVFLVLFFLVPIHPVLFFFELSAPLNLYEGISALYPAESDAGRTDGKMICEFIKNTDYSKVFLSVTVAQGILQKKNFSEIPRRMLFDLPVIREDEPAFLALTQLRWQYLFWHQDENGAKEQIKRLENLSEYLSDPVAAAELYCEFSYAESVFFSCTTQAEQYLKQAESAKGTNVYLLAEYVETQEGKENLQSALNAEPTAGIKDLYGALLSRADKKIPPESGN